MPSRRIRLLLAAGIMAGLTLPGAQPAVAGTAKTAAPVSVVITSVNPPYATARARVTVRGSLTNTSATTLSGLMIQLRSSGIRFTQRDQLRQYADGTNPAADGQALPRARDVIRGRLAPGATITWQAVLPVRELHLASFGVYPLAAQVIGPGGAALQTSRTFLPFWRPARRSHQSAIAWIWPLIDLPDQGPCAGLLNDNLALSLASRGRLGRLLAAGRSAAGQQARLTWALDPALLASVATMTGAYTTGTSPSCQPGRPRPASPAALSWLRGLRSAVAGRPAFVTPYADVDIAALTRANLDGDVHQAFTEGRAVAQHLLHRSFTPAAASHPGARALTSATAWPADGLANYAMMGSLAGVNGIRALVLSSSVMPPVAAVSHTPSAVTATPNEIGGAMRVLLADSTLTRLIGSVPAQSGTPGTVFAVRQRFLAETAMIVSQAPAGPAIVVAPPRRWNPPSSLASGLLTDTVGAPWLKPVSAGTLAADTHAAGQVARHEPDNVGTKLIRPSLLRQLRAVGVSVALVQSMAVHPGPQLARSVAGVESAAWRISPAARRRARALLNGITSYISNQEQRVSLISPGPITLGGQKGQIPITINNHLDHPVQVRVRLTIEQTRHGEFSVAREPGSTQHGNVVTTGVITVPANIVSNNKLKVRASYSGSTTISLKLLAADGQALPQKPVIMTVQATHFGTLALTILAAALGVFVITSAARAIRRDRAGPQPPGAGRAGDDAPSSSAQGGHGEAEGTDNVGHDRAEPGEAGPEHVLTEDADDYAPVPGGADRS